MKPIFLGADKGISATSLDLSRTGLDSVRVEAWGITEYDYKCGGAVPGYPGAIIEKVHPVKLSDGCWKFTIVGEGIIAARSDTQIIGYPRNTGELMGLDTIVDEWETSNPNKFKLGQRMTGGNIIVCTSVTAQPMNRQKTRFKVTATGQGILDQSKPYKESYNVTTQDWQRDSVRVNLAGGWTNYRKGSIAQAKAMKTISYISASLPDFTDVSRNATPINPPAIYTPFMSGQISDFTWLFPHGWTLMAIIADPIPGTTVGAVQLVFELRQQKIL